MGRDAHSGEGSRDLVSPDKEFPPDVPKDTTLCVWGGVGREVILSSTVWNTDRMAGAQAAILDFEMKAMYYR